MTTWREQMQPASFRGVPFQVETSSTPVGRRTQCHEYPLRDLPLVEDLGRATRRLQLTGFVIGDDCFQQRDALLAACDQTGAGELIHPYLGRLTVVLVECSISHERQAGGMVRFEMTFVETTNQNTPTVKANTAQSLSSANDQLKQSALERFNAAFSEIDRARIQAQRMQNQLNQALDFLHRNFSTLTRTIKTSEQLFESLRQSPNHFAINLLQQAQTVRITSHHTNSILKKLTLQSDNSRQFNLGKTLKGSEHLFIKATQQLIQDASLIQIANQLSQLTPTSPNQKVHFAALDIQSRDPVLPNDVMLTPDIRKSASSVKSLIWVLQDESSPKHSESLSHLCQVSMAHCDALLKPSVDLINRNVNSILSAIVLAYQQHGDARRAVEIQARNHVMHPGFVTSQTLWVATQ